MIGGGRRERARRKSRLVTGRRRLAPVGCRIVYVHECSHLPKSNLSPPPQNRVDSRIILALSSSTLRGGHEPQHRPDLSIFATDPQEFIAEDGDRQDAHRCRLQRLQSITTATAAAAVVRSSGIGSSSIISSVPSPSFSYIYTYLREAQSNFCRKNIATNNASLRSHRTGSSNSGMEYTILCTHIITGGKQIKTFTSVSLSL